MNFIINIRLKQTVHALQLGTTQFYQQVLVKIMSMFVIMFTNPLCILT
jgi:hypothetical protein